MRLREKLAGNDPSLLAHLEEERGRDHRRVLASPPAAETLRVYGVMLRKYKSWATTVGYQAEIGFLTDIKVADFVSWMKAERYAPKTVRVAVSALRHFAVREDISPLPSFEEAWARVDAYVAELAAQGLIVSEKDARLRP